MTNVVSRRRLTWPATSVVLTALVFGPHAAQAQIFGNLFGKKEPTLPDVRKDFKTTLIRKESANEPVPEPPADVFRIVEYDAPLGKNAAYLTPDPKDGKKHPAIVWITGGDCNTIGDVWSAAPPENDQTAAAYRKAGIVMMFPSLRGGNKNPGFKEGFWGEVDDVIAAADYLAKQSYVDPERVYLGGHSTGGTLVLLVAESTNRFRAVFSFGPVSYVHGYPEEYLPFEGFDDPASLENYYRGPLNWTRSIQSPVFGMEGEKSPNELWMTAYQGLNKNPLGRFFVVKNADHFNILAPVNKLLAAKIVADEGPKTNITLSDDELNALFAK